jgi:glutathione synthase/RimK-type ligase-like ATP-grasp enzyme
MILIFSESSDQHASAVESQLTRKGAIACRLNSDEVYRWTLECRNNEPVLHHDGRLVSADTIRSVFIRSLPDLPAFRSLAPRDDEIAAFSASQRFAQFEDCIRLLSDCVPTINTIAATQRAQSKSLQLRVACKVGLSVPKTYLGSDPAIAAEFIKASRAAGKRVCMKAVASTFLTIEEEKFAGFTDLIEQEDLDHLGSLRDCPAIIQEYIEKDYELRIAVVGDRSFACRIDSQAAGGATAVDWRRYNIPKTPHSVYNLPKSLEQQLQAFHAEFGLVLSSFDFVRSRDGEYVFLETNPFGRWLWIEDLSGLPITSAIADVLAAPATSTIA